MLLEHIQNAEIRKGLQVKRETTVKHNVPWELVGIFVQISNYKIYARTSPVLTIWSGPRQRNFLPVRFDTHHREYTE